MSTSDTQFQLPHRLEHFLAALSRLYKREHESEKLEIIVNAQVRVVEGATYEDWEDGGTNGHKVIFTLAEDLYLSFVNRRSTIESSICTDLNKLHNSQDEHFAEVIFELAEISDRDWRLESGVLQYPKRTVTKRAADRIWGEAGFRVFLSHKTEVKKETALLKDQLSLFGVAAFVAHEDILPTKEWQNEIESALESMDAFVALLTHDFHESLWTDQEVGYAIARSVPVVSVRLGRDPYGFIGKFQGLRCSWQEAPVEIAKLLIKNGRMIEAYIARLRQCGSFADGLELSKLLPLIETLTEKQVEDMRAAFSENSELNGCWGFTGVRAGQYGEGLAFHLSRITSQQYRLADRKIERA